MRGGSWANRAAGRRGAWLLLGGDLADASMVVAELEAARAGWRAAGRLRVLWSWFRSRNAAGMFPGEVGAVLCGCPPLASVQAGPLTTASAFRRLLADLGVRFSYFSGFVPYCIPMEITWRWKRGCLA